MSPRCSKAFSGITVDREFKMVLKTQRDLTEINSASSPFQIRTELEMQMVCNLREFKEFIDNEMIVILGQMDSPTQIFEHVFLVSTGDRKERNCCFITFQQNTSGLEKQVSG